MAVTRDIDPSDAQDLLERVPRACMTFTRDDCPAIEPAVFALCDSRYLVGLPERAESPGDGDEVVLLIDEGFHFWDLRAIYIRGRSKPAETPEGREPDLDWVEVEPTKIVAWDYGTMRKATGENRG